MKKYWFGVWKANHLVYVFSKDIFYNIAISFLMLKAQIASSHISFWVKARENLFWFILPLNKEKEYLENSTVTINIFCMV